MHYGRILAVLGVIVGVVGFILKKASSAGEEFLGPLSQANPAFPSNLDENTWSALYNDTAAAAVVFAIAMVAVLAAALIPPLNVPMKRLIGLSVAVLGVVMLAVGVFATLGAMDDADALTAAFAQAAAAGAVPEAYTVSIGLGWYLLIAAGALAAIGGVVSLIARPDENALSDS
ncbi:MAG TPA: hypothetical protein VLA29_00685 [Acidimicrobiia bacterium]|nr:hypothetical protein [Acidimicrobiia bacterium]